MPKPDAAGAIEEAPEEAPEEPPAEGAEGAAPPLDAAATYAAVLEKLDVPSLIEKDGEPIVR